MPAVWVPGGYSGCSDGAATRARPPPSARTKTRRSSAAAQPGHVRLESVRQGGRDLNRRVRVIALPDIQHSGEPANRPEFIESLVESVLSAGQSENFRSRQSQVTEMRPLALGAVASANQEEFSRLDEPDYFSSVG